VRQLLGKSFDLTFKQGISDAYHGSADDIWDWYTRGFGPLRQLAESLPADRLDHLKRDIDAYHGKYAVQAGLRVRREYLLTIGRQRQAPAIIGRRRTLRRRRRIEVLDSRVRVLAHLEPGDGPAMHFVGAVGEAERADVGIHAREAGVARHPHAAVRLDGVVDHA